MAYNYDETPDPMEDFDHALSCRAQELPERDMDGGFFHEEIDPEELAEFELGDEEMELICNDCSHTFLAPANGVERCPACGGENFDME